MQRRPYPRATSAAPPPAPIASTILITPATPAAAWAWPILDFTDPQQQRPLPVLPVGSRSAPAPRSDPPAASRSRAPPPHPHPPGPAPAAAQRPPDHPLLRRPVRRRQPIRRPVLVHRAAPHHRQHLMTMTPRITEPLQHHHPHAPRRTPCRRRALGVRLAPARRGPVPATGRTPRTTRGVAITVTPARQRPASTPRPAATAPPGATPPATTRHAVSTVTAGTLQAERIRDTARGDAREVARRGVPPRTVPGTCPGVRGNPPGRCRRIRRWRCRAARPGRSWPAPAPPTPVSSTSRCCGSIPIASRGEDPEKTPDRNSAASAREAGPRGR